MFTYICFEYLGISRDDTNRFIPTYLENHLLHADPYVSIDQQGVGALIEVAVEKCKKAKKNFRLSVCGSHAGDQKSISMFSRIGIDAISCEPNKIPAAKIAAAQEHILEVQRKSSAANQINWMPH